MKPEMRVSLLTNTRSDNADANNPINPITGRHDMTTYRSSQQSTSFPVPVRYDSSAGCSVGGLQDSHIQSLMKCTRTGFPPGSSDSGLVPYALNPSARDSLADFHADRYAGNFSVGSSSNRSHADREGSSCMESGASASIARGVSDYLV